MSKIRKILLAEDNPDDAELTLFGLRTMAPALEVDVVRDGLEVLAYLGANGPGGVKPLVLPSLILLDVKMPRMDGLAVLAALKRHPELRRIPVVMLTSSREPRDIAESYDLGANAYLVKSMELDDFIAAIGVAQKFWMEVNELP
jgi:CheY-like chemotaxis protein